MPSTELLYLYDEIDTKRDEHSVLVWRDREDGRVWMQCQGCSDEFESENPQVVLGLAQAHATGRVTRPPDAVLEKIVNEKWRSVWK